MTKIILAPQDMISKFPAGLERLLRLIDCDGALVTDESQLWDFDLEPNHRRQLALALGYIPHGSTHTWKLARDLEKE